MCLDVPASSLQYFIYQIYLCNKLSAGSVSKQYSMGTCAKSHIFSLC